MAIELTPDCGIHFYIDDNDKAFLEMEEKIKTLEAQVPRWISVKERLPENKQMVIGFTPCDGYMFVGYYVDDQKWKQWYIVTAMRSTKYMTKKVTHWMPLPEPPKEEKS